MDSDELQDLWSSGWIVYFQICHALIIMPVQKAGDCNYKPELTRAVWPMGLLFTFIFQRKLGLIFCDSLETSSLIFSEKKRKIFRNCVAHGPLVHFYLSKKIRLDFLWFTWNIKSYFLWKKRNIFRNCVAHGPLVYFYLSKKIRLDFLWFTWNIKSYFLWKKNEKYLGIVWPMGLLFTFIFQRKLGLIFCDSLETSSLIFSERKMKNI